MKWQKLLHHWPGFRNVGEGFLKQNHTDGNSAQYFKNGDFIKRMQNDIMMIMAGN